MKIPKDVFEAINNHPEGFDEMYNSIRNNSSTSRDAFDATCSRINESFPDYKPYKTYNSYRISRNKRVRGRNKRR